MAQDFTLKKAAALQALVTFAQIYLPRTQAVAEFAKEMTDSGFLAGGTNPITDADCAAQPSTAHLTAALVNSCVTALATIALSPANSTIVRQASNVPVSPGG